MNKKIIILVLTSFSIFLMIFYCLKHDETKKKEIKTDKKLYYYENVITNKNCNIYIKENNKYIKTGKIYRNVIITIKKEDKQKNNSENKNIRYVEIKNMNSKYYINIDNVNKTNKIPKKNNRYKNYIAFNENAIADNVNLYQNNKLIYTINKKMSLPIYIKDDDKYYVEFDNQLFYIKKEEVTIIEHNNTNKKNTPSVGVLNYHSFYNDSSQKEKEECNSIICSSTTQLKEHLDYIKNNNYFTPTMDELEKYIDGKLQLPKSVVITIDDGWKVKQGIEIMNDYKLNATLFLITGYYNPKDYQSDYLEIHSHTDLLHEGGKCLGGQGSGLKCLPKDVILDDLKISREKLNATTVLCYPFYEYNDYTIELAKEAGFTMAFKGETPNSDNLIKVGSNKYELPRFVVVNYTKIEDIEKYLK